MTRQLHESSTLLQNRTAPQWYGMDYQGPTGPKPPAYVRPDPATAVALMIAGASLLAVVGLIYTTRRR